MTILNSNLGELPVGKYSLEMNLTFWVRSASNRKWVCRFTSPIENRSRDFVFASYPDCSEMKAREFCLEIMEWVREGIDPIVSQWVAGKQRPHGSDNSTLGALIDRAERHEAVLKSAKSVALGYKNLRNVLGFRALRKDAGSVKLKEIDTILSARHEINANSARSAINKINKVYNIGVMLAVVENNPVKYLYRMKNIRYPGRRNVSCMAALAYADLPGLVQSLRESSRDPVVRQALESHILAASRPCEIIRMRWDDVDLEKGLWITPHKTFNARRTEQLHYVILTPRMMQILSERQKQRSSDTEFVFFTKKKKRNKESASAGCVMPAAPLSNNTLLEALKSLTSKPVTAHGMRATYSTWANSTAAAPSDLIEASIAHKEEIRIRRFGGIDKYLELRRELALKWEAFVLSEVERRQPAP